MEDMSMSYAPKDLPTGTRPIGEGIVYAIKSPMNYIPIGVALGIYLQTKSTKKALIVGGVVYFGYAMYLMGNRSGA